jgi:hypothetical protein
MLVIQLGEIAFMTSGHSCRNEESQLPGTYRSPTGVRIIREAIDIGSVIVVGGHNSGTTYPDVVWPGVVSPKCSWLVEPSSVERSVKQETKALKIS